jgi:glycosyltransferase involved in cell wall biosynthesis
MGTRAAPTVSFIVPAYQSAHLIGETLASLQAQDRGDWEAIVVDDGSTDDLAAALAPFAGDPRIRPYQFDHAGLATARNRGIERAAGRYLTFLDSDDMIEPSYVGEMVGALEADPSLAFVCCDGTMFGVADREGRRFSEFEPQVPPVTLERVLTRKFTVLVAATVRADVVRSVGGFAEQLRSAEDFDLWLRILMSGGKAAYRPRPLFRYRRRAGSLSNSPELFRTALAEVYRRAAERLGPDDPLAAYCRRAERNVLARLDLWRGRAALTAGRVAEADALLDRATRVLPRSRWKLMLRVLRVAPRLAVTVARLDSRRQSAVTRLTGA